MTDAHFPDKLPIQPFSRPLQGAIRVPGSKSITNRALVLAALAAPAVDGAPRLSTLTGALRSEDTEIMIQCLSDLGVVIECDWEKNRLTVQGAGGQIPVKDADLLVANSGTTMRFLTAFACLGNGRYRLDGIPRMRERPIQDLLSALQQIGIRVRSENDDGCPPVIVEANGIPGGKVRIKGNVSSQFLSGLLMAAPAARRDIHIDVEGTLVSLPYVDMTLGMIEMFGGVVHQNRYKHFHIPGGQQYLPRDFQIEPDASAASYFAGAAAILGGEIELTGTSATASLQGDVRFLDVLRQMGCRVTGGAKGIVVRGGELRGIDVDMNDISDTVMTLAIVACFAEGPTTIRNVAHIRHKETDRLSALATELQRIGAGVEEREDGIVIIPQPLHGAEIATYNDHRMAMSFALAGLKAEGVVILDPQCVRKTYPDFFTDLERLR